MSLPANNSGSNSSDSNQVEGQQEPQRSRPIRIQEHIEAASRIQATLGLGPAAQRANGEFPAGPNPRGAPTHTSLEQLRQVQQETQSILAAVNAGSERNGPHPSVAEASTARAQAGGTALQRHPTSVLTANQVEESKGRSPNDTNATSSPFSHINSLRDARPSNQTGLVHRNARLADLQSILQQNQSRIQHQVRNARNHEASHSLTQQVDSEGQMDGSSQRMRSLNITNPLQNINSTNFTSNVPTQASTQRANMNSQPGDSNPNSSQWPPVDLYSQIDALISSTNNQASQPGGTQELDNQTILQTILRQANTNQTAAGVVAAPSMQDNSLSVHAQQQILDSINATNAGANGNGRRRNNDDSNSQSTLNEEQMNDMQTNNSSLGDSSEPDEQLGEADHGHHHQVAIDQLRQREYQRIRDLRAASDSPDGANDDNDQDADIDEIANHLIGGGDGASSSNSSPQRRFRDQADPGLQSHSSDEEDASNTSQEDNVSASHRQEREINLNLRALGIGGGNAMAQLNRMTSNQGFGNQSYPQQDDIDDNDDVVSMSDSIGAIVSGNVGIAPRASQARIADIGTIQSANTRRVVESNVSRHQHRQQREEQKTAANQNIEELFKCFICFGKIEDAVICPSCSKLCCKDCMRKWLIEQRQQCPHCRSPLQVHQLVSCSRFVKEITEHIDTLNAVQPESGRDGTALDGEQILRTGTEVCKEHGARLDYYCQTCKTPICSDCAMFGGDKHKDHKFLRLAEVYEKHCDVIKKEAMGLKKRLKELTKHMNDVQRTIEKVTKAKEDKCKEIDNFVENIQAKLNQQLKNKLLTLLSQRGSMQDEIEQLEEFHSKLNQELTKMPKSSLIKKSGDLIRQLKEIHTKEPHRFVDNEVSIDFTSELVPQYEQSIFVIKNFSRIRQNQNQIVDENEIVYSDPPLVTRSGLTWRLKVYPNGNGIAKGNYISVFLEMLKGLPDTQTQKYEYRVEMINHRNQGAQVVREFASDFEVGECWGYNRFYRIDLLEREGYLNQADDSITLKFFVRAPYYSQHCSDQERHILNMQKMIDKQNKELEELKEKYNEAQKKLKKNASKVKKLKAVNENGEEDEKNDMKEIEADNQRVSQLLLNQRKEKQRKNEKVVQNHHQIQQVLFRKRIKNEEAQKSTEKEDEEEKKETIPPRKSKLESNTKFAIQIYNEEAEKKQHKQTLVANFEHSDDGNEHQQQSSSGDSKNMELNFYDRQNKNEGANSSRNDSLENDQNNSSNDSQKSNKLLKKFTSDGKQYQKAKYMDFKREDHYERVLNQHEDNSDGKRMNTSLSNESQNEEEIKEQHQYQILKQSLRALQERANSTFNQGAAQEQSKQEDVTKNFSVSDDNEEKKQGEEEDTDADAIANDGQPYPQGLISDDSNELIMMSPAPQSKKEQLKSNHSSDSHQDSLQIDAMNPGEDCEQSYVQSSLDGDSSQQNVKDDMFNISRVEDQNKNSNITEQLQTREKQANYEKKSQELRKFTIIQTKRVVKEPTEEESKFEELKQSSSQILNSINEKVLEKKKQTQLLKSQSQTGTTRASVTAGSTGGPSKLKISASSSTTKIDLGNSTANQKLLAQLKQKRISQINKESKNQ